MKGTEFLNKQIGPFPVVVWIGVVGGGAGLAFLMRGAFGGGRAPATQPIIVETVPLKPGSPQTPAPKLPTPQPPPLPPPPRGTTPSGPLPKGKTKPPEFPDKKKTPVPPKKPKIPTPRAPAPPVPPVSVPGDVPTSCEGVWGLPNGHPGPGDQAFIAWYKGYTLGERRGRWLAMNWALIGQNSPLPTTLYFQRQYWPEINRTRRKRGLRALTTVEFEAFDSEIQAAFRAGGGNPDVNKVLTDQVLLSLWNKYHVPYMCGAGFRAPNQRLT